MKRVAVSSIVAMFASMILFIHSAQTVDLIPPEEYSISLNGNVGQIPGKPNTVRQNGPGSYLMTSLVNPYCNQPDPAVDACYINWELAEANTDSVLNFVIFSINKRIVAQHGKSWTGDLKVPREKNGDGFKVKCGKLNSAGNPQMGIKYTVTIRAANSAGMDFSWDNEIYCPARIGAIPALQ